MLPRLSPFFVIVGVAIALARVSAALQSPSSAGVINGRVVEEGTNTPIADARVMVMVMMTAPPAAGQRPPEPYQANTGSDGTFRFEGLPPGRYRVSAQKTGYASLAPGSPPPALVVLEAGRPAASQVIAAAARRSDYRACPLARWRTDGGGARHTDAPSTGRSRWGTPLHVGSARDD